MRETAGGVLSHWSRVGTDFAIRQRFPELCSSCRRGACANEIEALQFRQPFEVYQSSIGNLGSPEVEILKMPKRVQMAQTEVSHLCICDPKHL